MKRKIQNSINSQYKREGLAEGLAEGRAEGIKETAKRFKENGVDIEIISKSTGLTTEEINEL